MDFSETDGINVGVGWTGRWQGMVDVSLDRRFDPSGRVTASAGMMNTHFRLLPGEEIRQPSILLHFRHGLSVEDGQNQFRRLLRKHHSPLDTAGTPLPTPCSFAAWGGMPDAHGAERPVGRLENRL
jgi:alpha-galactosidase